PVRAAREGTRAAQARTARLAHHAIGLGHGLPRLVQVLLRRRHRTLPRPHFALRQGAPLEEILASRRQLLLSVELSLLSGEHGPEGGALFREVPAGIGRQPLEAGGSGARVGGGAPPL